MAERELRAKTPSVRPAYQRGLREGNPGNRGGPGRPPNAYRLRARYWEEKSKGLEVLAKIVSGDILESLGTRDVTLEDGTVVSEIIVGQTKNSDRISAAKALHDAAGYAPARPVVELPEDAVAFVIVTPPVAKNAEEWLRLHKAGAA